MTNSIVISIKIGLIVVMLAVIAIWHYSTIQIEIGLHIPHRELLFLPILLASFWFGLKSGLITSVAVSLIYVPQVFAQGEFKINIWPVSFQILLFIVVAIMLGLLFERTKRQNEKMLVVENLAVLGRAAIAVGHEMKDLLNALKRMADHAKGLKSTELDRDFEKVMSRLEQMVEILSSFVTTEPVQLFSHDMNEVMRKIVDKYRKAAGKKGLLQRQRYPENGLRSLLRP